MGIARQILVGEAIEITQVLGTRSVGLAKRESKAKTLGVCLTYKKTCRASKCHYVLSTTLITKSIRKKKVMLL